MTAQAIGGDRPTYYTARLWNEDKWDYDELSGVLRDEGGVAWALGIHRPPYCYVISIRRHPDPPINPCRGTNPS